MIPRGVKSNLLQRDGIKSTVSPLAFIFIGKFDCMAQEWTKVTLRVEKEDLEPEVK